MSEFGASAHSIFGRRNKRSSGLPQPGLPGKGGELAGPVYRERVAKRLNDFTNQVGHSVMPKKTDFWRECDEITVK